MLEVPLGSVDSRWDLFSQELECELGLTAPISIRARGYFARPMPLEAFIESAAAWGLQYPGKMAERTRSGAPRPPPGAAR